jgi:multiple sugar transport system ATP-binding protein
MAIEFNHIVKIYPNGYEAIHGFDLTIEDGDFCVLVGPSGCGKSTTLRMLAGLEDITHGELKIDGKVVNNLPPKARGIAMVFQSYALYPTLTVYENMAFALDLAGFDEDVIESRVKETAAILGLSDYLDRLPKNLSGGQRQRVALGRAIIRHAKIFLMDEPLSNLDARQRVSMRSELVKIHRNVGATTVYVTHDQIEAMTMATKIVCMVVGVIKQVGTPEDLYFHPKNIFVAGFIGDPPMNFVKGSVKGKIFTSDLGELDISGIPAGKLKNMDGKKITLAYRPEHVVLELPEGAKKEDYLALDAKVEVYEMLGDVQNVYLDKNGVKSIIKASPDRKIEIESELPHFILKSDLHFFDTETEDAIPE